MINKVHIDVISKMKNKFKYSEFEELCKRYKMEPVSMYDFAQMNGILQTAIIEFPGELPHVAFGLFMKGLNAHHEARMKEHREKVASMRGKASHDVDNRPSGTRKCGSCGGAKNGGVA